MNDDTTLALEHLVRLVAADSTNPPRRTERIVAALEDCLGAGFEVRVTDLGAGSVAVLATRGTPSVIFNAHVDTVPVVPGWQRDPFALAVEDGFAYGLGACDTKGGAAALIAAARSSDAPVAMLFTTDEEAGDARCARWFAAEPRGYEAVIVSEPTENRAVIAHRGVGTARIAFHGDAGHSSGESRHSANHDLVRWATRALAFAEGRAKSGFDVRLNLGRIEGGDKPNVIAARAEVRFGVRPPPGTSPREVLEALFELAPADADHFVNFIGEPLPTRMHQRDAAQRIVERWGVPLGESVDFWTEAAIFSSVVPAVVYGPGSIKQAHSADEFVSLNSLEQAVRDYRTAFVAFDRRTSEHASLGAIATGSPVLSDLQAARLNEVTAHDVKGAPRS